VIAASKTSTSSTRVSRLDVHHELCLLGATGRDVRLPVGVADESLMSTEPPVGIEPTTFSLRVRCSTD
jgi:hypothetical protein